MYQKLKKTEASANGRSAMEAENHFKNEANPKNLKSRGNVFKILLVIAISAMLFSCSKGDNNNDNNGKNDNIDNNLPDNTMTILKDTIFNYNTDFDEGLVTYTDINDGEVSVYAAKGLIIVYFQDNVNLESANKIISQLNGEVIERIPAINYYVVKVSKGTESDFIKKIQNQGIEYISPYLIDEPCGYYTAIIDDYRTSSSHGNRVLSVFNGCSPHSGQQFMSKVEAGIGVKSINTQKGLNFLITDNEAFTAKANLVNMSYGPDRNNYPNGLIGDLSYYGAMKNRIIEIITRIKKMKKYRNDDIVFTIAAGNNGLPIYDKVIKPLYTWLSPEEQSILENNILIVGAIDTSPAAQQDAQQRGYLYSNTSSKDNAFAMVDISDIYPSDILFRGTSFAAPRALCYIAQKMEQNPTFTAVQALAEAKKEIAANNGIFAPPIPPVVDIKPVASVSNVKSTTATVTVSINAAEVLTQYPGALQVGCCNSASPTFSGYFNENANFSGTKNTYTFSLTGLTPQTPYYVYGWVKYGNTAADYLTGNTTLFTTAPADASSSSSLTGTLWSCYAYNFSFSGCFLNGATGFLLFSNATQVQFYNRTGISYNYDLELSGTYSFNGSTLNINFGNDVVFTGTIVNGNTMQGSGKHIISTTEIHNFKWNGTKQTSPPNVTFNNQPIDITDLK